MLFSSISFLYYFLPCVLTIYFLVPRRMKNVVLLISSLLFYAWGGIAYAGLMILMIITGYVMGLLLEKFHGQKWEPWILVFAIGCNLCVLVYFKFADVFPVGISFYTFQIMSYIVDVYRGEVAAQRDLATFGTYASMFPQLVAGPIVRYADVERQLDERSHTWEDAAYGVQRFVLGLSKKVLIANQLGELCDIFKASDERSILFYWLYAISFTLHIYFDFSGYSDMAVGLGKWFGFDFMENFQYPYISKSITEFWRRWHISLGNWFRDYVYIPLGGNRVSKSKWIFNIFVVWMLTGFWHGASWNFIVWGLLFAVFLIIEKLFLLKYLERTKIIGHIYVMLVVMIGFVIFNAVSLDEAMIYIGGMFGMGDLPLCNTETVYYWESYLILLILGIVGATPFPKKVISGTKAKNKGYFFIVESIAYMVLLLTVTAYLVDGSFNPFLYFRF